MNRRTTLVGGAVTVALVAGVATLADRAFDQGTPAAASEGSAGSATAEVAVRDLEQRTEIAGTLGYGQARPVTRAAGTAAGSPEGQEGQGGGIVTALPPVGSVLKRGDTALEVDGVPVPLLVGDRPLWRRLDGAAADGSDIEQLEANLVALGYADPDVLTVDREWTGLTTEAVRRWQQAEGREVTGAVDPSDVVLQPGPVRVASHPLAVGEAAEGEVLAVTDVTRQVTVDLPTTREGLLQPDREVEVVLPDGTVVPGIVTAISDVVAPGDGEDDPDPSVGDTPTREVTVTLDDSGVDAVERYDQAPVTVRVVSRAAEDVVAVPVDALLSVAGGDYAVELVEDDGATRLVGVEIGAFADGWVELTGDVLDGELGPGDLVVVPS